MTGEYIIFALVCVIVLLYLGIIHFCWLGGASKGKIAANARAKNGADRSSDYLSHFSKLECLQAPRGELR